MHELDRRVYDAIYRWTAANLRALLIVGIGALVYWFGTSPSWLIGSGDAAIFGAGNAPLERQILADPNKLPIMLLLFYLLGVTIAWQKPHK